MDALCAAPALPASSPALACGVAQSRAAADIDCLGAHSDRLGKHVHGTHTPQAYGTQAAATRRLILLTLCRDFLRRNFDGLLQLTIHGAKDLKAVNVRFDQHAASTHTQTHRPATAPSLCQTATVCMQFACDSGVQSVSLCSLICVHSRVC